MRYKKLYTQKEWNRFNKIAERENGNDITWQEIMCKKYEVILTDYKTRQEKIIEIAKKFNMKNFDLGLKKLDKGLTQFSKVMASNNKSKKRKQSSFF